MMSIIVAIEAAVFAALNARRKRAVVVSTLNPMAPEALPAQLLSRSLARVGGTTTSLDRLIACKAAELIRSLVRTQAFDQLVLSFISRVRSRCRRKGGGE